MKDILHKVHDDDDAFQQIIDFARVRINMYLDLPIKQTDLRGQLAGIVGANPSASFMYIYDVKARLRDLKDDLVANP